MADYDPPVAIIFRLRTSKSNGIGRKFLVGKCLNHLESSELCRVSFLENMGPGQGDDHLGWFSLSIIAEFDTARRSLVLLVNSAVHLLYLPRGRASRRCEVAGFGLNDDIPIRSVLSIADGTCGRQRTFILSAVSASHGATVTVFAVGAW